MSFKTDSATARTIGIDTGKYTLHMIGLDEKGTIVLREKIARGRIAARLVKSWSRLSEQNLRVDKWSLCRG
jgi:transposase